jgi:hypothetical protein
VDGLINLRGAANAIEVVNNAQLVSIAGLCGMTTSTTVGYAIGSNVVCCSTMNSIIGKIKYTTGNPINNQTVCTDTVCK